MNTDRLCSGRQGAGRQGAGKQGAGRLSAGRQGAGRQAGRVPLKLKQKLPKLCNIRQKRPWGARAVVAVAVAVAGRVEAGRVQGAGSGGVNLGAKVAKTV